MVNLGTFQYVGGRPGWYVVVCSPTGKFYFLAIHVDSFGNPAGIFDTLGIPWDEWIGDKYKNSLYAGDGVETLKKFRSLTLVKGSRNGRQHS